MTILFIDKKDNAELYNKALEACNWMKEHDKNKDFTFIELPEGGIKIFSPQGKNQAFRRGSYFYQTLKISYEVFWDRD
ncbi:MAG: hypothetical protein WC325_12815 [Candidatus Bathyarchaeia archaeon]